MYLLELNKYLYNKVQNRVKTAENLALFLLVGLARVFNNSIPIILTFIFVRFFKVNLEDVGQLTYILTALTIFTLVSDLGFSEVLQKFVNKVNPKEIIFPTIFWKLVSTVFFSFIIVILELNYHFFRLENALNLSLFVLAVIGSTYNVVILVFNALSKPAKSALYQIAYCFLVLVLLNVSIFFGFSVITSSLISLSISWVIILLAMFIDLLRMGFLKLHFKLSKDFLSFSFLNFFLIFAIMFYTQTDSFFIINLIPGSEGEFLNGIYKPIAMIGFLPKILAIMLVTPLFPWWSRMNEQRNYTHLFSATVKIFSILAGCVGLMFLGSLLYAEPLLKLIYAREVVAESGKIILPIIVLAFGMHSLNFNFSYFMQAVERKRTVFTISFLQIVVYLSVMIMVTPKGLVYVATAALITETVGLIMYLIDFLRFHISLNPNKR